MRTKNQLIPLKSIFIILMFIIFIVVMSGQENKKQINLNIAYFKIVHFHFVAENFR